MFMVLVTRPVPVLMVDTEGRYVAQVNYRQSPALDERQLEALTKRFVQHYLSQNSATIYEDAEISLAAMCPVLKKATHDEWVNGGKLAKVVERLQISRVLFSEFTLLKYLSSKDIQVETGGQIILGDDSRGDSISNFKLELSLQLVPLTSRNYLGIEVCSISFI